MVLVDHSFAELPLSINELNLNLIKEKKERQRERNKYISKRNSKPKSSQMKIPKPKSYLTGNCIKQYKELYL